MTFLAPAFLFAGIAAALVVVGLHFLVTRPPSLLAFPTTRFIPASTIVVTSVARRPQDLLLLLIRVAALLAIGAAFARPVFVPGKRDLARIIVVDHSLAIATSSEVVDSARSVLRNGDRLILTDTSARRISAAALDSLGAAGIGRGSLTAGLVQARRAAAELQLEADSIELILIAAFSVDEIDGATLPLRAHWPGRIRLIQVAARRDSASAVVALQAASNDPIRATHALVTGVSTGSPSIRLVRDQTPVNSQWIRAGGTLVEWPEHDPPTGWDMMADTVNAVVSSEGAMVFAFARSARPGRAVRAGDEVLAQWIDGVPAAIEVSLGQGCIRQVAIPVTARGDFVLRPDFQRLFRRLIAPCVTRAVASPISPLQLSALAGDGPLAQRSDIAPPESPETPLVPWLFAAAIVLMLAELRLRRRPEADQSVDAPMAKAA